MKGWFGRKPNPNKRKLIFLEKRKMKTAIAIGTFIFLFALLAAACQEDDDSDGGTYTYENCIPTSVTGEDRATLRIILKLVIGEYSDSDCNTNIITCNSEDDWEIPQGPMEALWVIPLHFTVPGATEDVVGRMELDNLLKEVYALNYPLLLFFDIGEQGYEAHKEQIDEQTIQWIFTYPDEGMVWTKTEP